MQQQEKGPFDPSKPSIQPPKQASLTKTVRAYAKGDSNTRKRDVAAVGIQQGLQRAANSRRLRSLGKTVVSHAAGKGSKRPAQGFHAPTGSMAPPGNSLQGEQTNGTINP
jgi:hypothetical protein